MTVVAADDVPALPAIHVDEQGRRRVDCRAILLLATPLFLDSVVQSLLNLTDLWFASTLGTEQTAAMGANYFLVLVFVLAVGGVGVGVGGSTCAGAPAAGSARRPHTDRHPSHLREGRRIR
jgi:Na+-driven multidrug efflux pump